MSAIFICGAAVIMAVVPYILGLVFGAFITTWPGQQRD
jgi:hypothetical protein